jgi:hypothetical protein
MTFRTSAPLLWLALPLVLFAAGCQKDAAEEAEAASTTEVVAETPVEPVADPGVDARTVEPPPPPMPVPGTDAAIIEDHSTPTAAAPTFDAKAFDGRYAADKTTLDIKADGTYVLSIDGNAIDGNWTLQPGGKKVTLDPNSKGETDRQLDIVSGDSVKIAGGATLKRQADAK